MSFLYSFVSFRLYSKPVLPLAEALNTIIEQTENKAPKNSNHFTFQADGGSPIGLFNENVSKAFDELITTSVEAGEQSGNLDEVLLRLAEYLEQRQDMGKQSWMALFVSHHSDYHINISGFRFDGLYRPKSHSGFENNNAELPAITKFL